MDIKQKIKSAWNKVTGKNRAAKSNGSDSKKNCGCGNNGCGCGDSELGADEVVREEVFPKTRCKTPRAKSCGCGTKKPASKRTRPTNGNYQMIDPDDDTCDTGKS